MHGVICTVVLAALSLTHAFPDGAPRSVCFGFPPGFITPNHPAGNASDAPGGFFIESDLRDTNFRFNATNVNETQTNYTSKGTIIIVEIYNNTLYFTFTIMFIMQLHCFPRDGHFAGLWSKSALLPVLAIFVPILRESSLNFHHRHGCWTVVIRLPVQEEVHQWVKITEFHTTCTSWYVMY